MDTINPATGEKLEHFEYDPSARIEETIQYSAEAFKAWRSLSHEFRSKKILALKNQLENHKDELARSMSTEMGKPISESLAEIKKSQLLCEYVAETGPKVLQSQQIPTSFQSSYVSFQPLGAILGIMPWNFPLWQTMRFALPALSAGNTILIKPAENVWGTGTLIQKIFEASGFGSGVAQTIKASVSVVGDIIDNPLVRGVSLTGSVRAGRDVGARAGRALKPCVLELGGSDPYVIMKDADLEQAAKFCVRGRFINSGQSCIAAKRLIVIEGVHDSFVEKLEAEIKALKIGSPLDPNTQVGPMAREDLLMQLESQVERSIKAGAVLRLGGRRLAGAGFFYEPTLLLNVGPGQAAFDEEVFGPVACVVRARDEEEAVRLANLSEYGLGAAVFSKNKDRAETIVRDYLESGIGFVNDFVKSDPALPFGGVKASGVGKELGPIGFFEFTNAKTICVG